MWRITMASVLAHKVRLALTALAVVLGVSFVVGTLVLTDTMNHTFDALFKQITAGVSVEVRSRLVLRDFHGGEDRAPLPASVLETVRRVDGVAEAEGTIQGYAQLVSPRTRKAIANGQAPTIGVSWLTDRSLSALRLRHGRGPERTGEIAIDASTATRHRIRVGDRVRVLLQSAPQDATVVGIFTFGTANNLAGATLTAFDTATAQRVLARPGEYSAISVRAAEGVSDGELKARIARVLDPRYEAVTGAEAGEDASNAIQDALGFFNTALLVFAGIALFVGAFLIFNTFSILVAQRTRELALLRAVGASRRQVLGSVLTEAAVVGAVASLAGLGLGLATAAGLKALLGAFGVELPGGGLVFRPRTVGWALVVGLGVTALAALLPARRASAVAPVAALRDVAAPPRSLRRRAIAGAVLTSVGAALLGAGLFGGVANAAAVVGMGAMATFLGVTALSPLVARPVARALGAPLPRLLLRSRRTAGVGTAAEIGRQNALRNPRRTAATAAALMVGLALVSAVSVLAASIKQSVSDLVDRSLGADYVVNAQNYVPFSTAVAERLRARPEVGAVSAMRFGIGKVEGSLTPILGVDAASLTRVLRVELLSGALAGLGDGLLVARGKADSLDVEAGDDVTVEFATTGKRTLRVAGIFEDNQLLGNVVISHTTYDANYSRRLDGLVLVAGSAGVPAERTRAAIEEVAADFPNVSVKDQQQLKADQQQQVDQLLGLISALLLLSILIAVIGIMNTLALSIFERTRELGLVRAIGMSRRQVRSMIRYESVLIALFGATLGLAVGTLFGWALVRAFRDEGITTLVVPGGQLVGYVLLAAVFGVVAAIWPARRAARLDVLAAISYE